jgi:hypothetical protein
MIVLRTNSSTLVTQPMFTLINTCSLTSRLEVFLNIPMVGKREAIFVTPNQSSTSVTVAVDEGIAVLPKHQK